MGDFASYWPPMTSHRGFRSQRVDLVETAFQLRMGAAQPVDDFLCPVVILALAFQRPARRGAGAEIAHVADLVGKLTSRAR